MTKEIKIRAMRAEDIPAVNTVQTLAYVPHFHEPHEVIAARFAACPNTAWVAEVQGRVTAYLVGYCSRRAKINKLNASFINDAEADCLYMHDLALAPAAQGKGVARALIETAELYAVSCGLRYLALLSVQNSREFWQKFGFEVSEVTDEVSYKNLETYLNEGGEVVYMVRSI